MWKKHLSLAVAVVVLMAPLAASAEENPRETDAEGAAFYERHIRPLLVQQCYECHSEEAGAQEGGLLLDRRSGWIKGGDTQKAVVPGQSDASLLIEAVSYANENLQMPPEAPLEAEQVRLLEEWIRRGAPGPKRDLGATEFSRLGDQEYLFAQAKEHWAFQPVAAVEPPAASDPVWNRNPIDRFVFAGLQAQGLTPSRRTDPRTLVRRLSYDLTGLPPTHAQVETWKSRLAPGGYEAALAELTDELLASPAFGEHIGRMWLDVARYADTDSFYRPDTRTPHYFPFAFTYRDYVIAAFNDDTPYDEFVREQLAADLMGPGEDAEENAPELAALGFLAVGPHANRNQAEALDDWIDVTTRGLMGLTVACARCHDHKYEPVPTADYYSLRGVFASLDRPSPIVEAALPKIAGYEADEEARADYEKKRSEIDAKIEEAGKKTKGGNRRSVAQQIRETELAELLLFHPGAPAHAMVVKEKRNPVNAFVFMRGDPRNRGENVPRRFPKILDPQQAPFPDDTSGRLQLAEKIVSAENPLTARVFVNRVWGLLMGDHLVDTPSDFGLQGDQPSHPELLDWLAAEFVSEGWSTKRLVRQIVLSQTYRQRSDHREEMAALDPENRYYWRSNRERLSVEALRDSMLAVSGQLEECSGGRAGPLWGDDYTRRRSIYGYINRFNLDPTLRVFDFPSPMSTQGERGESIVAPQALFAMNSPFVIDQAVALVHSKRFAECASDAERVAALFNAVLQRDPTPPEVERVAHFVERQQRFFEGSKSPIDSPWTLVAQSLMMSNEFQYVD